MNAFRFRSVVGRIVAVGVVWNGATCSAGKPAWDVPTARPPEPVKPALAQQWVGAHPVTAPRLYSGAHLEYVLMPIGGIGTGTIWLDGQGRLAVWQIFNNYDERPLPDSFFAVQARAEGGDPVVRILQSVPGSQDLPPMKSLVYEGGYPIARLTFSDPALPVEVRMEAFNPMIPLDTFNSSIPCAIFRLTARNSGRTPADVAFFGTLRNAAGNRNRVVRENGLVAVAMESATDPVLLSTPISLRTATGALASEQGLYWLDQAPGLSGRVATEMARAAAEGGVIVAAGVGPEFFKDVVRMRENRGEPAEALEVFEDFEGTNYLGWTITGNAFGKAPAAGTGPDQQDVRGFSGNGLVNTFASGGDSPQGTALSKPFRIERKHICFLVGGGSFTNETCVNLSVDGKVVRTAVGKGDEFLNAAAWDVSDLKGKEGMIEIVDRHSGSWGHVNLDRIVFSDTASEALLLEKNQTDRAAQAIGLAFGSVEAAAVPTPVNAVPSGAGREILGKAGGAWTVTRYTRLKGAALSDSGYRVLASTPDGDPLLLDGPLGKGRVVFALAPGLPWSWGTAVLAANVNTPLRPEERFVPGIASWGTMALATPETAAIARPVWSNASALHGFITNAVSGVALENAGLSEATGKDLNGILAVPFTLQPGQERAVTFMIAWHFPNVTRFEHAGNLYAHYWPDATAVARYVARNGGPLWEWTRLYHATLYQSNLPEEFLDAMSSQSVILRGPTCFVSGDGYFGGYEGCYGCCPLNCSHVWNYAQSHARLFPEIGQNMRISDFNVYLHANGETSHRQHVPQGAFIDGHCAAIEGAYREYQLSPDNEFLAKVWPGVKKAVDWMIRRYDGDHDGVPGGHQPNTYDCSVSGANTFIGSQYLSALAAAERMAAAMNAPEKVKDWRAIREAGMKNQDAKLWNGEYYIQVPETPPARDYNNGCHSDQLLGQWWAHMLGLGYLYPPEHARRALQAVMTHNFRTNFAGFKQAPRRYIPDNEGGLLMCTWPKNDRPASFIEYANEVWTGIEYSTAGAMIYEGMMAEARRIVKMARSRYDGRRRDGLDSGPGGNPFNELECGKFYARAMSSWGLLIASQGLILDGPAGIIGFRPNWQPEDHRSFFTAPEGWGLFVQSQSGSSQKERLEVRYGRLNARELVFAVPREVRAVAAVVRVGGRSVRAQADLLGDEVHVKLRKAIEVPAGRALDVALTWSP